MKRWLLLFMLLVLFCIMFSDEHAYAASIIEFRSYQFSSSKICQGDSAVYVDLEIENTGNSSILLHGAFVHFDWQAAEEYFIIGSNSSGEPWDLGKTLVSTNYTFRISFSVPINVNDGGHSFYFKVFYNDGSEAQWNPRAQDPFAELHIYSRYEPSYNSLIDIAEDKVMKANGHWFISPEANSLLQRAASCLDDAYSYADQEQWQSAFSRLQSTSLLVDQAYEAEQRFRTYLIIGGVVAIGAVISIGLFIRQRKRTLKLTSRKAKEQTEIE